MNGCYSTKAEGAGRYDPFGMGMVGRKWGEEYRFGFNGQEQDDEVYGNGNANTAMFWEYDTRLGRRWNVDPIINFSIPSYVAFNNNPIYFIDEHGNVAGDYFKKDGTYLGSDGKDDNKVYVADDKKDVKNKTTGKTETTFTNAQELSVTYSEFKDYSGLVYNEDLTAANGIAHAVYNYSQFSNKTIGTLLSGNYSSADKSYTVNNNSSNSRLAAASVIDALTGGVDPTNGATHWDGFDFAGGGLTRPKPTNQGIMLSQEHLDQFRAAWTDDEIRAFSAGDYTGWSPTLAAGTYRATQVNKGRVLYKSTAVLGKTIFWGPTKNAVVIVPTIIALPASADEITPMMPSYENPNAGYNWSYY
ncbi:MAG: hypothetical protein ACKVPJ_09325 [Chitinophagales bacterium]